MLREQEKKETLACSHTCKEGLDENLKVRERGKRRRGQKMG